MSVYRVIDKLEAEVKGGTWLPFGARIVGRDQILDLIEKLRSSLPEEVSTAKAVTKEKDRLLAQAKEDAEHIRAEATDQKSRALSESEIVRQAQTKSETIIAEAEKRARDVRRGADEYAEQILGGLDATLTKTHAEVQKGRQTLAAGRQGQGNGTTRESVRQS
jgi:cell division septum initiation protein DivIVA